MTTLPRRSPRLAITHTRDDVKLAVDILETMPRAPFKTPLSQSDDGYHEEICQDDAYVYFYTDGFGWARIAKAW